MKTVQILLACSLTLWVGLVVGTQLAGADGVGVCVAGVGADTGDTGTGSGAPYVGVNVHSPVPVSQTIPSTPATHGGTVVAGAGPDTATYDNPTDFQAACCAESGSPADCFAPVN